MNRVAGLSLLCCVLGCEAALVSVTSETVADETMTAEEELALRQCLGGLTLDAGAPTREDVEALLRTCLADAGFPSLPSRDGGALPFPRLDGGATLPARDGGFSFPRPDGGWARVDGGAPKMESCASGCSCPAGKQCVNPLQATCPARFAVCL